VIGWIVRATATVTSVIPAMIVPGRIIRAVTTVDSTAIVAGRIVRSLTTGKPATIITRGIIYALTTGEPAFVIPGRITDADPILLGDRRTGGLQRGAAGARTKYQRRKNRESYREPRHD
jgi:hypothetical protein